jgi:hypothetical protein
VDDGECGLLAGFHHRHFSLPPSSRFHASRPVTTQPRSPPGSRRCVHQALATETIAECIGSGTIWKAESNVEWLDLVSAPAAADWDVSFTVERINFLKKSVRGFQRKYEFDQMREVPFVRAAGKLAFATDVRGHLVQCSSASRFTAGAAGFFILSQSGNRPPA